MAEDEIEAYLQAGADDDEEVEDEGARYEVWPENWETVQAFLALSTQWRVNAFTGKFLGLIYSSVESTLRMMKIDNTPEVFHGLRVMEAAALEALNRGR